MGANFDGRALSVLSKADMRRLTHRSNIDKYARWQLYRAVKALREDGVGGEWVPLHGGTWSPFDTCPCLYIMMNP